MLSNSFYERLTRVLQKICEKLNSNRRFIREKVSLADARMVIDERNQAIYDTVQGVLNSING